MDIKAPTLASYSPSGQKVSTPVESGGSFADFLKPVSPMMEANKSNEAALTQAAQGTLSGNDLMQNVIEADLATAEFKAYWDKFLTATNDVLHSSM